MSLLKLRPSLPLTREGLGLKGRPLAKGFASGLIFFILCCGAFHSNAAMAETAKVVTDGAELSASNVSSKQFRWKAYIKRRWGVEVMYVRQTAAGYMLEFRYKILDPKKAKLLTKRKTKPVLTHVETGAKLVVPAPETTGPMRNTYNQVAGMTYWMLFGNPAKLVKPGDHVNIKIGEFMIDGLTVE